MPMRESGKPAGKAVVDPPAARRARVLMAVAALFFLLFCLNVVLGKLRIVLALDLPFLLPDVTEFLLLLFAALFFTLATLSREKAVGSRQGPAGDAT